MLSHPDKLPTRVIEISVSVSVSVISSSHHVPRYFPQKTFNFLIFDLYILTIYFLTAVFWSRWSYSLLRSSKGVTPLPVFSLQHPYTYFFWFSNWRTVMRSLSCSCSLASVTTQSSLRWWYHPDIWWVSNWTWYNSIFQFLLGRRCCYWLITCLQVIYLTWFYS